MKKYGLRIGDVGIEFPSIDDRQKALLAFTKGTDVKISNSGIKYRDGEGNFSVYDRDTKETLTTCGICSGVFSIDTCSEREYPHKHGWETKFGTETGFICEACFSKQLKSKELFDAKKLVEESEDV